MTAGIVIRCDGTPTDRPNMSLERCRAFLPTTALSPDEARHVHGKPRGWTGRWRPGPAGVYRTEDLCPACSPTPETQP